MAEPGPWWRWNEPPAKRGVVKNNSCCDFLLHSVHNPSGGREGSSCFLCCPSRRRSCEQQGGIGCHNPGVLQSPGGSPREGLRLGFARKARLTAVTSPHECMHSRACPVLLSAGLPAGGTWLPHFCTFCFCSLFLLPFAPLVCTPACSFSVFALVCVPVDVVLTDCRNQPFPPSSAAEFSILLSEHREDAGPFLAASWARI